MTEALSRSLTFHIGNGKVMILGEVRNHVRSHRSVSIFFLKEKGKPLLSLTVYEQTRTCPRVSLKTLTGLLFRACTLMQVVYPYIR